MKISKIKTEEKTKKLKSIFSIDLFDNDLVSSSMTGEITLYNTSGCFLKTFKKHSCSALCVKFSPDGKNIIVSYDDGTIVVYDREGEIKFSHKSHAGDASGLVFTDKYLVSVGYDGCVVFYELDGSKIVKKMKAHNEKITGISFSKYNKLMVTQGGDGLTLFHNLTIIKKIPPSEGVVLENFFSRMDWSGDGNFLACGLFFNNKANSVEIFDKNLVPMYSLIGHAAPIEVVAFNPNTFFHNKPYQIVVLASQDLSISMWNTVKPFPFLLLKNVSEMPILDMKWNEQGTVLYFCSYDGLIKKIEFDDGELGAVSLRESPSGDCELFLTEENVKLHTVQQNNLIKKKLSKIKMGDKGKRNVADNTLINSKVEENNISGSNEKALEAKNQNPPLTVDVNHVGKAVYTETIPTTKSTDIKPTVKRRKVVPTLLDNGSVFGTDQFFVFNYNKQLFTPPETKPFVKTFGDFKIEFDTGKKCVCVFRDNVLFYNVFGEIKTVCVSPKYLAICSDVFKIYNLVTGTLSLPFIVTCGICFIDIYKDKILYLECDGKLTIIDLQKQSTFSTSLPMFGELVSVNFDKKYFVRCVFKTLECFLDKATKLWYIKKPTFNTIETTDVDFTNTVDETINQLENDFLVYKKLKRSDKLKKVVKRIIKCLRPLNEVPEVIENKLRQMLIDMNKLGHTKFVQRSLAELNENYNFQYFVVDILKEISKKQRK